MVRLLCIFTLVTAGCAVDAPSYPLRPHRLDPISADRLPGSAAVAEHATFATWKADPQRLSVDIERAVKRSDWGLLEVHGAAREGEPIRAEALLPDNRVAEIHAWRISGSEVAAAVAIGRFGDNAMQDGFLQMLADTLADKPKPKRGGTFELP